MKVSLSSPLSLFLSDGIGLKFSFFSFKIQFVILISFRFIAVKLIAKIYVGFLPRVRVQYNTFVHFCCIRLYPVKRRVDLKKRVN